MTAKLVSAFFGGVLIATLGACGSGPHLEVPTASAGNYRSINPIGINAVSASEVCVIGNLTRQDGTPEGLILSSETGGKTWSRRASEIHDLQRLSFQAVYFGDRLRGWVAGIRVDNEGRTRPTVFRTEDGGNHWREALLPQDPGVISTVVHNLNFTTDRDGVVGVTLIDAEAGKEVESFFTTQDGGRSWIASNYREEPKGPVYDALASFIDAKRGYRIATTRHPGVTMVEITGSGGQDWMPVSELTLGALPTYY